MVGFLRTVGGVGGRSCHLRRSAGPPIDIRTCRGRSPTMRVMPAELVFPDLPERVREVIRTLGDAGHEVAIVGGAVRDRLIGLAHRGEWDAATAARPEEVVALFPGATWENRFGTVTIGPTPVVEVTSYRTEGTYRDRR